MLKISTWIGLAGLVVACGTNGAADAQTGSPLAFTISGTLENATTDSIRLHEYDGYEFKVVRAAPLVKTGNSATFSMSGSVPGRGLYLLATELTQQRQVGVQLVIGEDAVIKLKATLPQFGQTVEIEEGKSNQEWLVFNRRTMELQNQLQMTNMRIAQQAQLGQKSPALTQTVDSLFKVQYAFQQEQSSKKGLIGKLTRAYAYLPLDANPEAQKTGIKPANYLTQNLFKGFDFKDPELGYNPIFYEKVRAYVQTMALEYAVPADKLIAELKALRSKLTAGSKADEMFLLGCIVSGEQTGQQSTTGLEVLLFGCKEYVAAYPTRKRVQVLSQIIGQTETRLVSERKTAIGSIPPDIKLKDPKGKEYSLYSLKGKVVLLDFWASWCGPCRKENPNVVQAYQKFKPKGFEVFSVSLDNNGANWEQAIEKDGLIWPYHVSDLKGWKAAPAQDYGVTSIPATFLLDREGRIVAKNLRGPALEEKLRELLN
jgi:thiol-disulfide isomerase/thioredoxin